MFTSRSLALIGKPAKSSGGTPGAAVGAGRMPAAAYGGGGDDEPLASEAAAVRSSWKRAPNDEPAESGEENAGGLGMNAFTFGSPLAS